MIESAFIRQCKRMRPAWRRASVFALQPRLNGDSTGYVVKDSGIIYTWKLFIATFGLLCVLQAIWYLTLQNAIVKYIGLPMAAIFLIAIYAAAATYTNVWMIKGDCAEVRRRVLGVTFAVRAVSGVRLVQYWALIHYPRGTMRSGTVLVVLDSDIYYIVLLMTKNDTKESHKE